MTPEDVEVIEKKPEMKVCKYFLSAEAVYWSILISPIALFVYISKYLNWCCIESLYRVLTIPVTIVGLWIIYTNCNVPLNKLDGISLLFLIGSLSWILVLVFYTCFYISGTKRDEIKYMKDKIWWSKK